MGKSIPLVTIVLAGLLMSAGVLGGIMWGRTFSAGYSLALNMYKLQAWNSADDTEITSIDFNGGLISEAVASQSTSFTFWVCPEMSPLPVGEAVDFYMDWSSVPTGATVTVYRLGALGGGGTPVEVTSGSLVYQFPPEWETADGKIELRIELEIEADQPQGTYEFSVDLTGID